MNQPIHATWDGEAFQPLQRHHNLLTGEMVIGQVYRLEIDHDRSMPSHRHQFASLHDAWITLPENIAGQFPSFDHFRKRLLIECGFYHQRDIVCQSKSEAERWLRELRSRDDYAAYSVSRNVIVERVAQSQSIKAMGNAEFQRSKQAILDHAWGLCGLNVTPVNRGATSLNGEVS